MLFAGALTLFYLVNHHSEHIRLLSWKTVTVSISIYLAIVMYFALNDILLVIQGNVAQVDHRRLLVTGSYQLRTRGRRLGESSCGDIGTAVTKFVLMVILYIVTEVFLALRSHRELQLAAWGLVGAHIIGFSVAEAFGNIQVCPPYSDSPGLSFLLILIAIVTLCLMMFGGGLIRRKVCGDEIDAWEASWLHQCHHTEDEFFAFGVGFMLSLMLRFAITGTVPDIHAVGKYRSQAECNELLVVSISYGILVMLLGGGIFHIKQLELDGFDERWQRALRLLELTCTMTMGWLLLFWLNWQFWESSSDEGIDGTGNVLSGRMYIFLFLALIALVAILGLDFVASYFPHLVGGLQVLSEAFLLMLGLGWENVFMSINSGVVKHVEDETAKVLIRSALSLAMCVIVMPAWVLYILPHSLEHDHHQHDHDEHNGDGHDKRASTFTVNLFSHRTSQNKHELDDVPLRALPAASSPMRDEADGVETGFAVSNSAPAGSAPTWITQETQDLDRLDNEIQLSQAPTRQSPWKIGKRIDRE
jgi:hypothetical protein